MLSIEQVRGLTSDFRWLGDNNPNYGFSNNGLWLMVQFTHFTDNQNWVIDVNYSQLTMVDFYIIADDQIIAKKQQGSRRAGQRHRIPIFETSIPPNKPIELYIRVQSDRSPLIVPVSIRSQTNYSNVMLTDSILWGLFYGGLIILVIYNVVLFFSMREISLLVYCGYISTVLIWQFVWGGHIHWLTSSATTLWLIDQINIIFIAIGIISGIFSITFLNTRVNAPKSHTLVTVILYMLGLLALISALTTTTIWLNLVIYAVAILAICSYIAAGLESYANKFQPARYFIFAWGILASGAIGGILSLIGVLPSNHFTAHCFQIGVFLEAGLFSIALMDKSRNQLKMEVAQATDDLCNNMELIEEQNVRLDIARKDAIKASHVKSQFLANMSHEIRTPLNAILGFSRELSTASLTTEKLEQVKIINDAADNLLIIVNDVLDFSKIEAGKLTLNNQPFSPNQLFEEIISVMAKSAHQQHLEFIYQLEPLPDKLIGDAFRIKQILNNLLGNALKFTSQGHILFSARGENQAHGLYELTLKIEDTGIGISRQDRKKLFSAFSQVDEALNRSYQGTGLGLVISQELIKLMRGRLALTSIIGKGSTFIVSLKMSQLTDRCFLSPSEEWQDKHVVIFDPIPISRNASAKLLCFLGAKVTCVESIMYLNELRSSCDHFDYLFACIPQARLDSRNDVLSYLLEFKADKRVLLYSGLEPFTHYPSLSHHFDTQLRLPLTPGKIEDLFKTPQFVDTTPTQQQLVNLPRVKILAVDDMDMNLKLIDTWLATSPADLTLCSSGEDAVAKCHLEEYDLILMDVQMPNMDGLQATQKIRKTTLNLGTPIVAVTAHAFKEDQERLLALGMDDYLPKPIELGQLIGIINRWCEPVDSEREKFPSLNWSLALSRAHGNEQVAKEMLASFIQQLPFCIEAINKAWVSSDLGELFHQVHRIHGASCYIGASQFQSLCKLLEQAIKLDRQDLINDRVPELLSESNALIEVARDKLA